MTRTWILLATLALTACGGGDKPSEPAPSAAPANPETPKLDAKSLAATADAAGLVPSVIETQKALNASGVEGSLSSKMVKHSFDLAAERDLDRVAVRTGVILADMLLTIKTAQKDALITDLGAVGVGMKQLKGGADIAATIKDIQDRLKSDAITREELLQEADELSGALIPELEFNGRKRTVPLIQAGSWLEGANLVAKATPADNPTAAEGLLKQPKVVAYFIGYVKGEGADRTPDGVSDKLLSSLETLKGIADKPEPLTSQDIATIIKVTDDVLALL